MEKEIPPPAPPPKKPLAACMQAAEFLGKLLVWAKSGRKATRFRVDLAGVRNGSGDLLGLSGGRKGPKGNLGQQHVALHRQWTIYTSFRRQTKHFARLRPFLYSILLCDNMKSDRPTNRNLTENKDMDYIRDMQSNISFSLHDSRIAQIEINENKLSLKMDRIFQYTDNEEKWYQGIIEFTKIEKEECNVMVFNTPYGYDGVKSFSGRELSFEEFEKQYPNAEFEVITEGYCGYDTTFQGYIWQGENNPLFGIMRIWNTGDMIYRIP